MGYWPTPHWDEHSSPWVRGKIDRKHDTMAANYDICSANVALKHFADDLQPLTEKNGQTAEHHPT